jgi:hypothetical protein
MVNSMFDLVQFLTENIFHPINKSIKRYCTAGGTEITNVPRKKDLIALRRLRWLGEKLAGRVRDCLAGPVDPKSKFVSYNRHFTQIWQSLSEKQGCGIRALQNKISEENLYQAWSPSLSDGGFKSHRMRCRRSCMMNYNAPHAFVAINHVPKLGLFGLFFCLFSI